MLKDRDMDKKYSDSLLPLGIGGSFFAMLVLMLLAGTLVGVLLGDLQEYTQLGGVVLLVIFVVLLIGPMLYNRKRSIFEQERSVIDVFDGFGTLQGLRGAFFRLIIYNEGIEIRAFYHRYFIPFEKIKQVSIEKGLIGHRINFVTEIIGIPDYLASSDQKFQAVALHIQKETLSQRAASAD